MTIGNNLYGQLERLYDKMILMRDEDNKFSNTPPEQDTKFLRLILTTKFLETYLNNIVDTAEDHRIVACLNDDPNIKDFSVIKDIAQECCDSLDSSCRDSVDLMIIDVVSGLDNMAVQSYDSYKVKDLYAKEVIKNFAIDFAEASRFLKNELN